MSMVVSPYALGTTVAPFAPSDLASLKAWYDGSLLTGSDGDRKASWPDQTANAYNGSSANGALLKTGANGINSKNVLQFDASVNQGYDVSSSLLNGATEGCFFAVCKAANDPASSDSHAGALIDAFTSDTGGSKSSHHPYSDGKIYEHFGATVRLTGINPTPALTTARIYSAHISGSAGSATANLYIDGTSIGSQSSLTVGFGNVTRRIGYSYSGSQFYEGKIAEICVFNSVLTTGDRQKVEGYLAWKWGLQSQLPGGHPYASSPP